MYTFYRNKKDSSDFLSSLDKNKTTDRQTERQWHILAQVSRLIATVLLVHHRKDWHFPKLWGGGDGSSFGLNAIMMHADLTFAYDLRSGA